MGMKEVEAIVGRVRDRVVLGSEGGAGGGKSPVESFEDVSCETISNYL
jgi:hypothetical protein